jgi:hypothetical protein
MPNYERGTYEPGDEVRVFDGSEDDEDPEGSRLPLLIVLALLVLAMFGGVVWMAYSYGVVHGRTEPQLLAAAPGPARIAPANPGGAETPYKGFKIYEQPAPPDDEADATPPTAAPATTTAKVAAPSPAVTAAAKPAAPVEAPKAAAPAPVAAVKPAAPPPVTAKPQPKLAVAAPVRMAPPPESPATAPPKSLMSPAAKPVVAKPVAAAPVAAKPAAVKPAAAPAASGSYVLQIGAYKSQSDADNAWRSYKAKHAALLAGYGPDVAQADLGDKGIWYRLRIAGFASKDVASAMCDRLKADGGSCFLGK